MQIQLNGAGSDVPTATTIGALVDTSHPRGRNGVAVAVNGVVVRRQAWDDTVLTDGDRVELLVAVQGGA